MTCQVFLVGPMGGIVTSRYGLDPPTDHLVTCTIADRTYLPSVLCVSKLLISYTVSTENVKFLDLFLV